MANFDERSGVVYCKTPWGQWGQTIEEVFIEMDVPQGTKSRDVKCKIKANSISLTVNNNDVFKVHYIIVLQRASVSLSIVKVLSKMILSVPMQVQLTYICT